MPETNPPTPEDSTRAFLTHAGTPLTRATIDKWFETTAYDDVPNDLAAAELEELEAMRSGPDSFAETEDVSSPPLLSESTVNEYVAYRRGLSDGAEIVLARLARVIPATDELIYDSAYTPEHEGRWHIAEVNPAHETPERKEELLAEAFSPKP